MTRRPEAIVLLAAILSTPAFARADDAQPSPPDQAAPPTAPPSQFPPPPTSAVPAPPAPTPQWGASVPPGQWVYTAQYGWIWLPYGDAYTWVPSDGWGEPYAYGWCADFGWSWVVAPWVWGFGPWPYFGFYGPDRFVWYQRGWWRDPGRWRWSDPDDFPRRPAPRPALGGGVVRPAPRGGFVGGGRPAPTFRGGHSMPSIGGRGGAGYAVHGGGGGGGYAVHGGGSHGGRR